MKYSSVSALAVAFGLFSMSAQACELPGWSMGGTNGASVSSNFSTIWSQTPGHIRSGCLRAVTESGSETLMSLENCVGGQHFIKAVLGSPNGMAAQDLGCGSVIPAIEDPAIAERARAEALALEEKAKQEEMARQARAEEEARRAREEEAARQARLEEEARAAALIAARQNCAIEIARLGASNINFETNKADLKADALPVLNQIADRMRSCDSAAFDIEGHTDSRGGYDYNVDLSQRRAQSVVSYLVSQGIDTSRLSARGYGPDRPIASNDTREGLAMNRRIEFVLK